MDDQGTRDIFLGRPSKNVTKNNCQTKGKHQMDTHRTTLNFEKCCPSSKPCRMAISTELKQPLTGYNYHLKIGGQSTRIHTELDQKRWSSRRMKSTRCLRSKSSNRLNPNRNCQFSPPRKWTARSHSVLTTKKLKAGTVRDFYPIAHMDEYIEPLGDANIFLILDANRGC